MFTSLYSFDIDKTFNTEAEAVDYAVKRLEDGNSSYSQIVIEVKQILKAKHPAVDVVSVDFETFKKDCKCHQETNEPAGK